MKDLKIQKLFELDDVKPYENKHVLLVDDVISTGSTIISCAETFSGINGCKISMVLLLLIVEFLIFARNFLGMSEAIVIDTTLNKKRKYAKLLPQAEAMIKNQR